jgi:hypothetical protein
MQDLASNLFQCGTGEIVFKAELILESLTVLRSNAYGLKHLT